MSLDVLGKHKKEKKIHTRIESIEHFTHSIHAVPVYFTRFDQILRDVL